MSVVVARPHTLADVALPRAGWLQNVLLVVAASLLTAAAAQVEIRLPWTPVPVTGQTFAVLLTGIVLGARRAFMAMALYLLEGAAGLPFFAGGAAGVAALVGPSGGYLIAFPYAAFVTGLLAEKAWDRKPLTMFFTMLLGSTLIFALGLAQLSRFVPANQLVGAGLAPFVLGDVIKSALAAAAFPLAWKWAGGRESK
ncbi:MAG: biotin transporter BioY [Candidatus Eisenbacteria bacterium]